MLALRSLLLGPRLLSSSILTYSSTQTRRTFPSSSSAPPQFHHRHHHHHHHWSGLQNWRDAPINDNRTWGPNGPCQPHPSSSSAEDQTASASSLAEFGALVLSTPDPLTKSTLSHLAFSRWRCHDLPVGSTRPPNRPARPTRPALVFFLPSPTPISNSRSLRHFVNRFVDLTALRKMQVSPKEIPAHKSSGLPLNAYMLHNLAHVELNAIDLAWDTVVRYSPHRDVLGDQFFSDFARVADDESRHFAWCSQRLSELGFR